MKDLLIHEFLDIEEMLKKLNDYRDRVLEAVNNNVKDAEIKRLNHNIQLLEGLQAGDLVQYKRELYSHWAIYIGNGKIVHLSGPEERSLSGIGLLSTNVMHRTEVRIDDFLDILKDSYAYRNNSKDNEITPLPESDILTRAFSKIGCHYYDLFTFNCEHFVNWCRYDIPFSDQSSSIIHFGSRVTNELRNFNEFLRNVFTKRKAEVTAGDNANRLDDRPARI